MCTIHVTRFVIVIVIEECGVVCDYRYKGVWCMVDNTQLYKRNAEMHNVPPNVHRDQISKIWPDFQNLTRGVYL
jgi:hypothetical protein